MTGAPVALTQPAGVTVTSMPCTLVEAPMSDRVPGLSALTLAPVASWPGQRLLAAHAVALEQRALQVM